MSTGCCGRLTTDCCDLLMVPSGCLRDALCFTVPPCFCCAPPGLLGVGNNDIEGLLRRVAVKEIDFVGEVVVVVLVENEWSSLDSGRSGDIPRLVADRGRGKREDSRGRAEGRVGRAKVRESSIEPVDTTRATMRFRI